MNQLIIPAGFELVNFSWDRLPEILRSGSCLVKPAPALYISPHQAPAVRGVECKAFEEDAERWDGLS